MSFHKKLERLTNRARDMNWTRRSTQPQPNVDQPDKPPASTININSDSLPHSRSRTPTSYSRDTRSANDPVSISPCLPSVSTGAIAGIPDGLHSPSPSGRMPASDPGAWKSLRTLFRVLDQGATVFGPLKMVVNELIECIVIYEVRMYDHVLILCII